MKSPIKFFGGKNSMSKKINLHFPEPSSYLTYVEAYGGSGAMLLSNPIGHVEIYNDIYENVYSLFKVLSNNVLFDEFKRRCDIAIYSAQLKKEYKEKLRLNISIVDRAYYFWYINRTSYNGVGGMNIMKIIRRGMSKSTSDFLSSVDKLKEIHDRLSAVIILNEDALSLIKRMDSDNTFMYLDPPYHLSTRSSGGYIHDYTDTNHESFIDLVLTLKAKVLISGYACEAYKRLDTKFDRIDFDVSMSDGNNSVKMKVESLWKNY